jgi:hypothetical protein
MGQIALLLESRKSGFLGIWKTSKWATGSPRLQVTVIAQPATDEELKMISEEFSVSLQPAEIRECVCHMRDRTGDCESLNGAWTNLEKFIL